MRILVNTSEAGYMFRAGPGMNDEFCLQPIKNLRGISDTRSIVLAIVDTATPGSIANRAAEEMIRQKYMKVVDAGELTGIAQRHVAVLEERPDGKGGTYGSFKTLNEITGDGMSVVSPGVFTKLFPEKKSPKSEEAPTHTAPQTSGGGGGSRGNR